MKNQITFLKPYLRGWPIIILSMFAAYWLASKYILYITPEYESTTKLRLADLNEGVPNSNLFKNFDLFANSNKIGSEIELFKSHDLINKTLKKVSFDVSVFRKGNIKNTELYNDSPILIKATSISETHYNKAFLLKLLNKDTYEITTPDGQKLSGRINDTIHLGSTSICIQLNQKLILKKRDVKVSDNYDFILHSKDKLISDILKNLDITASDKDIPVIRINFKSPHPEKAAEFPNALAETYIEDYLNMKYGAANVTVDFLNKQIGDIRQKLDQSENAIRNYRDGKSITNIPQEVETDLRKIAQLKIQETNLKMSLEAAKSLENYLEKGKGHLLELAPNFEAFNDLLTTEMVKKIKQLQAEKKDLLLQYTPKDEKVTVIDSKINDLTEYITESVRNTRKNLESKYENLTNDISEAEKVFVSVPEKERMLTILTREFEIYQQSYNFLNQKKIEAEIARSAKIAFHRIISPASISKTPVSPNKIIIKLIYTLLGLMIAIGGIFTVHTLKAKVNDSATIESKSLIPLIAQIPKFQSDNSKENFFLSLLTQWEIKKILTKNNTICFNGFKDQDGVQYAYNGVVKALESQNKKILQIRIENTHADTTSVIASASNNENESAEKRYFTLNYLRTFSIESLCEFLKTTSKAYDHILIHNSSFGQPFTLALMVASDINLICMDSRLTPEKRIIETDLLKEEYQLQNVYFLLNRAGYTPNLINDIRQIVKLTIKSLLNYRRILKR
ncbi:MAG: GNVR domain-containing protein [Sediminibacterium sp.]|nr:GNVR domain-containing protein [Sediminibacterium sp.]